jgi:hypothetical protein
MRLVLPGVVNSIGVTTTPEGVRFVYDAFKREPKANYSMVQASTYENEEYLPPDYISTLLDDYPQELISAYLMGEFVNLTSGTVYRNYDRIRCRSAEVIKDREPLHIGQDFNVGNMASVINVERDSGWHVVGELSGVWHAFYAPNQGCADLQEDRQSTCDSTLAWPHKNGQHSPIPRC